MLKRPDANEVHLFLAQLTATPDQEQTCLGYLNEEERIRANRFISPLDQQRFIIAHGILRLLLGRYLQAAPASIAFTFNAQKKPALITAAGLRFNLSHSRDMAVYAFTTSGEIGVDIEKIQLDEKMNVAERFFSEQETSALKGLPDHERAAMFFRFWAKKEAIIKAHGKGLAVPLSSFSVSAATQPEQVSLDQAVWSLYSLDLHPDYAAALALDKPLTRLTLGEVINLEPIFKSMT